MCLISSTRYYSVKVVGKLNRKKLIIKQFCLEGDETSLLCMCVLRGLDIYNCKTMQKKCVCVCVCRGYNESNFPLMESKHFGFCEYSVVLQAESHIYR